jgi:hypothetical protein
VVPSFASGITLTSPRRQSQSANQYRCIESNRHPRLSRANRFSPRLASMSSMGGLASPRRRRSAVCPIPLDLSQVPVTIVRITSLRRLYCLYRVSPSLIREHHKPPDWTLIMKQHQRWRGCERAVLLLAASTICVSCGIAQEVAPRLTPSPAQQLTEHNKQRPMTKEVNLSIDGTFRVAVVTRSGYYVSGARVTLTRQPLGSTDGVKQAAATDRPPEQVTVITAPGSPTVFMGIKPGSYSARVEVREKTSQAVLLVKAASQDSTRAGQTQVLLPSPDDNDPADGMPDEEPDNSRRRVGAAVLVGSGLATAIAVPLSLQHHERRRASP